MAIQREQRGGNPLCGLPHFSKQLSAAITPTSGFAIAVSLFVLLWQSNLYKAVAAATASATPLKREFSDPVSLGEESQPPDWEPLIYITIKGQNRFLY